jgi:hypothetical protein
MKSVAERDFLLSHCPSANSELTQTRPALNRRSLAGGRCKAAGRKAIIQRGALALEEVVAWQI